MFWFTSFTVLLLASGYYFYIRDSTPVDVKLRSSYDYIIVGGGTAGALLAARLSENANKTVLLLEAGREADDPMVKIPAGLPQLLFTDMDWQYYTVPQKNSYFGNNDKIGYWPRGKVLGGSGSINGLVYTRGLPKLFNQWAGAGCEGWSYDEVLQYFMKSENNQNKEYVRSGVHGTSGPMTVIDSYTTGDNAAIFLEAAKTAGYETSDINSGQDLGKGAFMSMQGTIENGRRLSTANAFLNKARSRKNLDVSTYSRVTRVVIEKNRAVGVEVIKKGRKERVAASGEVILSAGSIGSPQLLMLSGVGPKKHLQDLNIPVIADLQVGESLQDHMMYFTRVSVNASITVTIPMIESYGTFLKYLLFGTGTLTSTAFFEVNGFARTTIKDSAQLYRYVQFHVFNAAFDKRLNNYNFKPETWERLTTTETEHNFILLAVLSEPQSRGTIRLRSSDPFDDPLIDPNYLDHPDDVESLKQGIRIGLDIIGTKPYQKVAAKAIDDTPPSCKHHAYMTDAYWECLIRHTSVTIYHPTSTCKMGPVSDPNSVVDPQLRVKGIKGLRVVDASVMPTIASGNTNAPVVMIAEKAADMIRGDNEL